MKKKKRLCFVYFLLPINWTVVPCWTSSLGPLLPLGHSDLHSWLDIHSEEMGFDLSNATSHLSITIGFFFSLARAPVSPAPFQSQLWMINWRLMLWQIGWVIAIAGLATAQNSIEGSYAPYWWTLFLTFFINFAVIITLLLGNLIRFRNTVCYPFPLYNPIPRHTL